MKAGIKIISLILLVLLVGLLSIGCGSRGGADIRLEGLTLGTVTMEGKPVAGLPSDKIDLLLEASAKTVLVSSSADSTTLTIRPSGATIEIKADGISIKGLKPGRIKVEWTTTEQD